MTTPIYGEGAGGNTTVTVTEPLEVKTKTEAHIAVHAGQVYDMQYEHVALIKDAELDFLITVGANFDHIRGVQFYTGAGDMRVSLYEDAATSSDGTPLLEAVDRNRDSRSTPTTWFYIAPTITDIGTSISEQWIPPSAAGTGAEGIQLADGDAGNFILKQNTKYIYRIINKGKSTISFFLDITWIETAGID